MSETEESIWAAGVAARLRMLQNKSADHPDQRRDFVAEALAEVMRTIPAQHQESYLAALSARFPTWTASATTSPPPPAVVPDSATPEEMADVLVAIASQLPAEAKEAVLRKLAVLMPKTAAVPLSEVAKQLQIKFGLSGPANLDRVVPLLNLLHDLLVKVDQVTCRTVQNLPDRQDFHQVRADDLQEAIKSFLDTNHGANVDDLTQTLLKTLEKHRRAMAALMASHVGMRQVPSAGRDFARWFHEFFAPHSIEDVARTHRRIIGPSLEELCWRKFVERFSEELATQEHIERRVKESVANTTERIFQLRI